MVGFCYWYLYVWRIDKINCICIYFVIYDVIGGEILFINFFEKVEILLCKVKLVYFIFKIFLRIFILYYILIFWLEES